MKLFSRRAARQKPEHVRIKPQRMGFAFDPAKVPRYWADKDPVLDPLHPSGRGFDFNLYDAYGRVPYVRYTQNF